MELVKQRTQLVIATLAAMLLVAGGICWLMRGGAKPVSPIRPTESLPADVELRLSKVVFRGIANGKILWKVEAENFDFSNNQTVFTVKGLKKASLLNNGKQEFTISADALERNTLSGDLTISGHVTVLGDQLLFRTPMLTWSDRNQILNIPKTLSAQLGDITVMAEKGATYNVISGTLRSNGKLQVGLKGSSLHATGVIIETQSSRFTMYGPIHATILVEEAEDLLEGKDVPKVPDIPEEIRDRYHAYMKSKGRR